MKVIVEQGELVESGWFTFHIFDNDDREAVFKRNDAESLVRFLQAILDLEVEDEATTRLKDAAPDLLIACKGFISVLKGFNGMLEVHAKDDEIVGALDALLDQYGAITNAAIDKAEGRC